MNRFVLASLLIAASVRGQGSIVATPNPLDTVTIDPNPAPATILKARDLLRSRHEAVRSRRPGASGGAISAGEPPAPTAAPEPSAPAPYLDKLPANELSNPAPKVFPDHAGLKKAAVDAAALAAPPPPPPAPPEGLRGVSLHGLMENDAVAALMARSKRADVRKLLDGLVAGKQVLDEGAMLVRVARTLGAMAPDRPADVEHMAAPVPLPAAEVGDVLLFELKGKKHVAIYYGENRFAWAGRAGVSLASLDRLPWPGTLVAVLRMPSL